MKKRVISWALILAMCLTLLPVSAFATTTVSGTCGDNLTWSIQDDILTIQGTGNMFNYGTEGVPWRDNQYRYNIQKIVLNSNMTSIGDCAFFRFINLTGNVVIPEGVTKIGSWSFDLSSISSINLPVSLMEIGEQAFFRCEALTDVYYAGTQEQWEKIKIGELNDSLTGATIHYNWSKSDSDHTCGDNLTWSLVNGVLTISGTGAMENFEYVEYGEDHWTYTSPWYFSRCSDVIQSLILKDGVTSIGKYAFPSCQDLKSAIIPVSVTLIGEYAFFDTFRLTDIYYAGTEDQWNTITIEANNDYLTGATIHYQGNSDTVSDYYIEPILLGDLTINHSGTATAYFCVKDKNGTPLSEKDLQYLLNGVSGSTKVTSDKNGIVGVTTPYTEQNATFCAVFSADNGITVHNETQAFDVTVKQLSYTQSWTGVFNGGMDLGTEAGFEGDIGPVELYAKLASIALKFGGSSIISIEDEYDDEERTLTLSSSNSADSGLELSSGIVSKISKTNKITPIGISGGVNVSHQIENGLKIKDYDPTNQAQLKQVGIFALAAPLYSASSVLIYKVVEEANRKICNQEAVENSVTLESGIDAVQVNLGSYSSSLGGFDNTTEWSFKDSYDYIDDTFSTEKSFKTDSSSGIGSPSIEVGNSDYSVTGSIGKYILGAGQSNSKEISATRKIGSDFPDSISYKVYNGDEVDYEQYVTTKDIYSTVTFEGEEAKSILNSQYDLKKWVDGENPFYGIQDAIDSMRMSGKTASIKETTKVKEADSYSLPISLGAGLKVGVNLGISGEHAISWNSQNGALYQNAIYTTSVSDVQTEDIDAVKGDLDDLILEAVRTALPDLIESIKNAAGNIVDGIKMEMLEIAKKSQNWFVSIYTVSSGSSERYSTRSTADTSYAIATVPSAQVSTDSVKLYATVGNPYEITVYTDTTQTTMVKDAELVKDPLEIKLRYTTEMLQSAGATEDAEVKLFRLDDEKHCYVCEESEVEKDVMTVTAKLSKNGEYILAVDSIPEENSIFKVTFNANGGALTGVSSMQTGADGTLSSLPGNPTRSGYSFQGWYTAANGGTQVTTATVFSADTTVYAHWTSNGGNFGTVSSFLDVSTDKYYYNAVQWAVKNSITTGYSDGTFRPDNSCTRAQMVTFLWRCAGEPEPVSENNPFTDIASTAYYYKAVLWAVEKGITNGTSDTTFEPDKTVTRAQTVTFLYRYADGPAVSNSNYFFDVESGKYFTDAIQWAVANNITTGYADGTFRPYNNCTRAQIVTFMYRDFA